MHTVHTVHTHHHHDHDDDNHLRNKNRDDHTPLSYVAKIITTTLTKQKKTKTK